MVDAKRCGVGWTEGIAPTGIELINADNVLQRVFVFYRQSSRREFMDVIGQQTEITRKEKNKAMPHIFDEGGLLSKADTLAAYLQEHFVFAAIELLGDLLLRLRPLFPQHDLCEWRSHAV